MKKKLPSTVNFETKHADNGTVTLIGLDGHDIKTFLKSCAAAAFDGKHYKLAMVEADASPAQHNFTFVVYESILTYLEWESNEINRLRIRATFEDIFLNLAKSPDNDLYDYDYWVVATIDFETGELKNERLRPLSSWSIGHKAEFLAFLKSTTTSTWSDYKFPETKDFKGQPKGEKSTVERPDKFYQLSI
jgi:hypothetical protein